MFNALNRFISRLDGDGAGPAQGQRDNLEGYGFQVLRNTSLDLPIEPWFDYIIGINGRMIDNPDSRLFAQEVRNCAGGSVSLGIWSAKGQRTRALQIPVPADTAALGLSLQYAPVAAASNIWHVLDVPANSPADAAGLLPYSDYVLGTPDGVNLDGEGALGELVDDHVGRPLRLWVYNHEYDVTREVDITPSRDWGGQGAIGCTLGFGALHRLPPPLSEPVHGPGETMFDGGGDGFTNLGGGGAVPPPPPGAGSSDFLIPAQMVSVEQQHTDPAAGAAATTDSAPPQATMPTRNKRKEGRAANSNRGMMDDYFAEQEQKSKELEGGGSGSRSTPVGKTPPPPPPKAGGPPPPSAAKEETEDGA